MIYRDRALERRKGFNPDYERVAADLAGLVGGSTAGELTSISVEDSKFLGGDVDHTHLVKGLDYALLQKVGKSALPLYLYMFRRRYSSYMLVVCSLLLWGSDINKLLVMLVTKLESRFAV